MWVYGYGSLVWNPSFHYERVLSGVVRGYSRRFWQLSPDHRGTEQNPGRTVTLCADEAGQTWGLAYKVRAEHVEATRQYLDIREQAGYKCIEVTFHPDNGEAPFPLHVYIADLIDNIYYTGHTECEEIAETIIKSRGKSGTNLEYALRLADTHRRLAPHVQDNHLMEIEAALLRLCEQRKVEDDILRTLGYKLPYLEAAKTKALPRSTIETTTKVAQAI